METQSVTILDLLQYYKAEIPDIVDEDEWAKMCCPFHGDTHASAAVHIANNAFVCHGCDVSGDVVNVVARWEGFGTIEEPDRREAYEWIERVFGGSARPVSRTIHADEKPRPNEWRAALFD